MKSFLILFVSVKLVFASQFRFASFNIRNFNLDHDYLPNTSTEDLSTVISKISADIVGIQEIVEGEEFAKFIKKNHPEFKLKLSRCGGTTRQKLGYLYNPKKFKLLQFTEDTSFTMKCHNGSRPLAIARFKIKNTSTKLLAINVHLKAGGKPRSLRIRYRQLGRLNQVIKKLQRKYPHHELFLLGDFNTTEYLKNRKNYEFTKFLKRGQLKNPTKNLGCSSYWEPEDDYFESSHLDHILFEKSFAKKISSLFVQKYGHCQALTCQTQNEMGIFYESVSDHCPIVTQFDLP